MAALCILAPAFAQQVITTIAGTDWIFPGDGKPAVQAPLGGLLAMGVAADRNGNYYIADQDNFMVMKVTPDGVLHVVAGNGLLGYSGDGGPATSASLGLPVGVAVDAAGSLYIVDEGLNGVRKVSPDGTISTIAGVDPISGYGGDEGPATSALLNEPSSIAVDSAGNVYIGDEKNHRVRKVTPAGIITTVAGTGVAGFSGDGGPATEAQLDDVNGVAVDGAGNLYVAVTSSIPVPPFHNVVRKVDPSGIITSIAGGGNSLGSNIGALTAAIIPTDVAVDDGGNVYITDFVQFRVVKVTPDGLLTNVAGAGQGLGLSGDGGPAIRAGLNVPHGVAVGPSGIIYIADGGNNRIRAVRPDGIINTVAGNGQFRFAGDAGPAISATLFRPVAVTADTKGNIYIAEGNQNRVRRVSPTGIISVYAGTGTPGYSGDGGPAMQATLNFPIGVAADRLGNLYIADGENTVIRRVGPDGIISTLAGTGSSGFTGDRGPANQAAVNFPEAVAVDASGNLYLADTNNHRIRKVDTAGIITTIAGNGNRGDTGDNGPALAATLSLPAGIAVDRAGNVFFAEGLVRDNNGVIVPGAGNRVRRVSPDGTITTVAGTGAISPAGDGGPAVQAGLFSPGGLAVDAAGNLYIADVFHQRVRVVSPAGIISAFAGNGIAAYFGDGGAAADAGLSGPTDVAFDPAGNLLIADWFNDRVRAVLAKPPSFQAAPLVLNFSADAGSPPTPQQTVSLQSPVPGLLFAESAFTTDGAAWLQVSPMAGGMPVGLTVAADASRLTAGTYRGTIRVTSPNASPTTATATVNLTVRPPVPGKLNVKADSFAFSFFQGSAPQSQALNIANDGGLPLTYSAGAFGPTAPAIAIAPASGTLTGYNASSVTVTADPTGLAPGTYTVTLAVTASTGEERDLPLTMTVSQIPQSISLLQRGLTFTAVAGGGVSPAQSVGIVNLGQGALRWTASASVLPGAGSWLAVTPASGSSDGSTRAATPVTVGADPAGLDPGQYYGQIAIDAPNADNSPQVAMVVLNVLPPGSDPGPVVQPAGLIFTGAAGAESPGSQTVTVANLTNAPLTFTTGVLTIDGAGWLVAVPGQSTVAPGDANRIVVQPTTGKLAPGVYQASVTLLFGGGTSQTVNVVFVVGSTATPNPKARKAAAGDCPTQLVPRFTSFTSGISVPAGWPTSLSVSVVDDCGAPMLSGSVIAQFSNGDPPVALAPAQNGAWIGTWQAGSVSPAVTVKVTAQDSDRQLAGAAEVSGGVVDNPGPPVLSSSGVVNAASLKQQAPVAPGSLISIFGSRLSTGRNSAPSLPWPIDMDGTEVQIQGRQIPLMDSSDGRIDAVLPFDLPVNTRLPLVVRRGSSLTLPSQVTIAPAVPAIFTRDNSGAGQGMIFGATPGAPVHPGDTVVIQCTGLGAVNPSATAGDAAPSSPAAAAKTPVGVNIGGADAEVKGAVLQPGLTGVYQVTAVVPAGVATGNAVPVFLTVAGQASPIVTMAVE